MTSGGCPRAALAVAAHFAALAARRGLAEQRSRNDGTGRLPRRHGRAYARLARQRVPPPAAAAGVSHLIPRLLAKQPVTDA
jgi:hypothetical protein